MLQWENWVADNDRCCKGEIHGKDLDESTEQEAPEEGPSSEKKRYIHSNAEKMYR